MAALLHRGQAERQCRGPRLQPRGLHARVNSDLVGKYVNIASRASAFINRQFGGRLQYGPDTAALSEGARALAARVQECYEAREFGRAIREIMAYADRINQDFDAHQPWVLAKDAAKAAQLQDVCSRALYGFKVLSVLLAPVLPEVARRAARELFGLDADFTWQDAQVLPGSVKPYKHLMTRVDAKQLDACSMRRRRPRPVKRRQKRPAMRARSRSRSSSASSCAWRASSTPSWWPAPTSS